MPKETLPDNIVKTNATISHFRDAIYTRFNSNPNTYHARFTIAGSSSSEATFETQPKSEEDQSVRTGTVRYTPKEGEGIEQSNRAAFIAFRMIACYYMWDDNLNSITCELDDGTDKVKFTYTPSRVPYNPGSEKIGVLEREIVEGSE